MNSANEIWMSITPVLQEKYTAIAFTTWFGQVEALDFKMDQLILSCPSDFKAKMIRDRFQSDIEQILHDLFNRELDPMYPYLTYQDFLNACGLTEEELDLG